MCHPNGTKLTLRAKKEAILSAGIFQSPRLLMLSGIGSRSYLEAIADWILKDKEKEKEKGDEIKHGVSSLC